MEEEYLEYACAYIFYYNMLINLKDKGELTEHHMQGITVQMDKYTDEKDQHVCKRHGITLDFFK